MVGKRSPGKPRIGNGQITEMLRLRRQGKSITAIAQATGCHRQTVRAYLRERQADILADEVRKQLLIDELRRHVDDLTQFAASLVGRLTVPALPDETRDASAVLGFPKGLDSDPESTKRKRRQEDRQHEMLFNSLQEHTRRKVRWQALDEWEHAWGNCRSGLDDLREKARAMIENNPNLDNALLNMIKEDSREKDPIVKITHVVLDTIGQRVLQDKLDPECPVVQTAPYNQQTTVLKPIESSNYYVLSFSDKKLANKAEEVTNQVGKDLLKSDLVKQLANEVRAMRTVIEEIDNALDPFILRPLILRTRCDLCPA